MMKLQLRLGLKCRECGEMLDDANRAAAKTNIRLFGIKAGWKLCRCQERVSKKVRTEIQDRRGFVRHVYKRVFVEAGTGDNLDHWSCHRQDGGA